MPAILDLKKHAAVPETKPEPFSSSSPSTPDLPSQIIWVAPEFEKKEKKSSWFFTGSLIMLALIAAAVLIMKSFLFAIIILLAGLTIFLYSKKEPNQVKFSLTGGGIKIDNISYPYPNLKSFWIFYAPPQIKYLSIESKKTALPFIKIPLGEQDPVEVRSFLVQFLPEKHQEESLIDTIARGLRF